MFHSDRQPIRADGLTRREGITGRGIRPDEADRIEGIERYRDEFAKLV